MWQPSELDLQSQQWLTEADVPEKTFHEKLASRCPGALVHLSLKGHKTKATEKGNPRLLTCGAEVGQ